MSHILIVGQKFSPLTDYLSDHGHEYTYLQDIAKTKFPDKKFKHRVVADFTSKETVIEAIDSLPTKIDAAITVYENYILPTAWITEHLGIPGIPVRSAEACTDKFVMRSMFDRAPENISPDFMTVTSEDDVRAFADNHAFPIILKPANLAKSLLVTKSNSLEELQQNYQKSITLLESTYSKYAANRTPKLIIEEYLDGTIHSVDAFVDADGTPHVLEQVVDYQTGYDIGFDDNFHYSRTLPSTLSLSSQQTLRHCAEVGIRALGMKSCPAHVEIIMTKNGPRIVEIGARNGGYRDRMHSLANGIDITGIALAIALGDTPQISATRNDSCAVLELFPKAPGHFVRIDNIDTLEKLPSLQYLSVKAEQGQLIGKSADGFKMTAVVILHHSDADQLQKDLNYITDNCHVITR